MFKLECIFLYVTWWSLKSGSHLQEVVTHGSSTVTYNNLARLTAILNTDSLMFAIQQILLSSPTVHLVQPGRPGSPSMCVFAPENRAVCKRPGLEKIKDQCLQTLLFSLLKACKARGSIQRNINKIKYARVDQSLNPGSRRPLISVSQRFLFALVSSSRGYI